MAIAFRSEAHNHADYHGNNLVISKPSGVQNGDIMLAWVAVHDWGFEPAIVTCDGWTYVDDYTVGYFTRVTLLWKRASSEGSSYTFNAPSSTHMCGTIVAYSGCVASGSPIDVYSNSAYGTENSTIRAFSVTTTEDNDMLVACGFAFLNKGNSSSPPPGMAERVDYQSSALQSQLLVTVADALQANAGASGNKDFTLSEAGVTKHGMLVALKPYQAVQTLYPTGIASAEAFGAPTLIPGAVTLSPSGIASLEAFGSPVVTPHFTLYPTGIASEEAFGVPTIVFDQYVLPDGIASQEAFGAVVVTPGGVQLLPSGIASAEAFGTVIVAAISPGDPRKARAFEGWIQGVGKKTRAFMGWVLTGEQYITPTGIESGEAFGAPTVIPGTITISPTGIPSAEAFGSPQLNLIILPTGIEPEEAFGTPTLTPGGVTIYPSGIASEETFGTPTVVVEIPRVYFIEGSAELRGIEGRAFLVVAGGSVLLERLAGRARV